MAKINIVPNVSVPSIRGWAFVLIAGLVLAVVALLDRGGLDDLRPAADGSTGCTLQVSADVLNLRAGPSAESALEEVLDRGQEVDGLRTVTAGYRELEDGRWAADEFLTPVPGTDCG